MTSNAVKSRKLRLKMKTTKYFRSISINTIENLVLRDSIVKVSAIS